MPRADREATYAAPAISWSGFYAGVQAGGGWSEADYRFPANNFFGFAGTAFSMEPDGAIYGGQVGYNFQFGSWLLGVEVSYSGSTMQDSVTGIEPLFPNDKWTTRVEDIFTATARIGYATPTMLYCAKGGFASSEISLNALSGVPVPNVPFDDEGRANGWTVGGGLEYRIHRNLSLVLEYNYIELDSERFRQAPPFPVVADMDEMRIHTVMGRLNILIGQ
jgi:outer membrane immunogenic protein